MSLLKFPLTSPIRALTKTNCYLGTLTGKLLFINAVGTRKLVSVQPSVTLITPSTGATITTLADHDETLVLTPAATLAALTIVLPKTADCRLGQIKRINSTQVVTALTVSVSGSGTVTGAALTAAAVNTPYAFQCVSLAGAGTWLRIQ